MSAPRSDMPESTPPEAESAANATGKTQGLPSHRGNSAIEWHHMWRVVFVSLFGLLGLTGVLLMTVYSPSTSSAWGSVWYVETQLPAGWFIRGLHRFGSDALIVLAPMYLAFLLLTRLHRAPHHARWWAGLAFLMGGMAAALAGYLLPWDQHGYWGMTVRLNIVSRTPWVGPWLRTMLVGGTELGTLTLTRFYTLHVLVLPAILTGVLFWWVRRSKPGESVSLECRHKAPTDAQSSRHVHRLKTARLNGALSWLVVFGVILAATCYAHWFSETPPLSAPADPSVVDYPARPEWFNLFLFQWLKAFEGPQAEFIGSVAVPGGVLIILALIPWIDRGSRWRIDRYFAVLFCGVVFAGSVGLTIAALWEDARPRDAVVDAARTRQARGELLTAKQESALRAASFHRQRARASLRASRAIELADENGIPPEGPLPLLANDPTIRGPELFAAHCASCHRFDGHNGLGEIPTEPATSSDLYEFGTRSWLRTFLANPMSTEHFGLMKKPDGEPAHTRMFEWLGETRTGLPDEASREAFEENLEAIGAYLESESLAPGRLAESPSDATSDVESNAPGRGDAEAVVPDGPSALPDSSPQRDATGHDPSATVESESVELIREGRAFFMSTCNECHSYRGVRSGTFRAPEMFGYGSVDWIEWMIRAPGDDALFRSRGREPAQMPSFEDRLSEQQRRLIAQWIHQTRDISH